MKKETYIKMTEPFRSNPSRAKALHIINKIITWGNVICYPILLVYMIWTKSPYLFRAIIVPLDVYIILSVFRYIVNRKRPYEVFELPPVIPKDTKGKSFPSRHVFSAFMIALTFLLWSPFPYIGIVLLVIACIMAVIRVISGIHFISDVICGCAVAVVAAVLGYIVF